MSLHHSAGPVCPLCEAKLVQAHPYLRDWFHDVKARYVNVHVSWSYRGLEDQESAFLQGKTKLHYPKSAHNRTVRDLPQSYALDLFLEDEDGNARWPQPWFAKLNEENQASKLPIFWGGAWKKLGDADHFEYRPVTVAP